MIDQPQSPASADVPGWQPERMALTSEDLKAAAGVKPAALLRRSLLVFLPVCAIVVLAMLVLYRVQYQATHLELKAAERQAVELAAATSMAELESLRSDLLYLAHSVLLTRWLDSDKPSDRAVLARDLLNFSRQRALYDQVRVFDTDGRETLRINWNNGRPGLVDADQLQDKSARYYIQAMLALGHDQVFVSPFDLNVEHGIIEQPLKPVVRLGTPVYDSGGHKRGILVLNYLAQRLLDSISGVSPRTGSMLWLVNEDGYWLRGPARDMEWGFMFRQRSHQRLGEVYPVMWRAITEGPAKAQVEIEAGSFSYVRLSPQTLFSSSTIAEPGWTLVCFTPSAVVAAQDAQLARGLGGAGGAFILLFAGISGAMGYQSLRRRQADEHVRASEARFRQLLASAPDAIICVDADGRILLFNDTAERWFGYSRDELLGQAIERLIPESGRARHVAQREGYMAAPRARPMGVDLEIFGRRKDGSRFPLEISLSPQGSGKNLQVTAIVRDISAHRQAEQARKEAQERYRQLMYNLPVGVYRNTPGPQGRFIEANPALVEMFEAGSMEEFLGRTVSALYPDPQQRRAFSDKVLKNGAVSGEEVQLVTLKGRVFWASISAVRRTDDSGEIYFDGIVEDISARKEQERRIDELNHALGRRAAELEVANRELETFSYSVSHDLRAPLRALDGFSQVLIEDYADKLDADGVGYLERLRNASRRMGLLIDDILKLSRVTRSELQPDGVKLSELVRSVADELQEREPQRHVDVAIEPGLTVRGDARLLRVALDNLLGNAWKFTAKRDRARIEFGRAQQSGESVYFVRDNGVGFDMKYAEKLFGAFQRLHAADEFPGTGIGLATVQRVIHKHGGRIWVDATPGEGAVFYFTL